MYIDKCINEKRIRGGSEHTISIERKCVPGILGSAARSNNDEGEPNTYRPIQENGVREMTRVDRRYSVIPRRRNDGQLGQRKLSEMKSIIHLHLTLLPVSLYTTTFNKLMQTYAQIYV